MIVTIPAGQSEACATFNILDDGLFEGLESFGVVLTSSDLAVDPQFSSAVVNINDDGKNLSNLNNSIHGQSYYSVDVYYCRAQWYGRFN